MLHDARTNCLAHVQDSTACADYGVHAESRYSSSIGILVGRTTTTRPICEFAGGDARPRGRGIDAVASGPAGRSSCASLWIPSRGRSPPEYGTLTYCWRALDLRSARSKRAMARRSGGRIACKPNSLLPGDCFPNRRNDISFF
jgi:hypothetical protein